MAKYQPRGAQSFKVAHHKQELRSLYVTTKGVFTAQEGWELRSDMLHDTAYWDKGKIRSGQYLGYEKQRQGGKFHDRIAQRAVRRVDEGCLLMRGQLTIEAKRHAIDMRNARASREGFQDDFIIHHDVRYQR